MFSQESKVAVLESKLNIYEELSREMLAKLETAVDKISEGNSRIANILAKHDERIEQTAKTDELIIKMIENLREESKEEKEYIGSKIKNLEEKVENLTKFRWQIGGVVALFVVLIGALDFSNFNLVNNPIPSQVQLQK